MRANPPIILDEGSEIVCGEIKSGGSKSLREARVTRDRNRGFASCCAARRQATRCSHKITDEIHASVIGICSKALKQVNFGVMHMVYIESKFEQMCVMAPGQRVCDLVPSFVRILRAIEKVGHTEGKATKAANCGIVDLNLWRTAELRNRLACDGGLSELELKIPAILVTQFVRYRAGNRRGQAGNAPVVLHIVVAKALHATVDHRRGLDALGRIPPQPIVGERSMVLGIDVPIDLRQKDKLVASSRHGTGQIREQA